LLKKVLPNGQTAPEAFFDLLADDLQWTITGSTYLSKTYTSKKQFLDDLSTH